MSMYREHEQARARVRVARFPVETTDWDAAPRRLPVNWAGAVLLCLMALSTGFVLAWGYTILRLMQIV
jgi:hypothetical protein